MTTILDNSRISKHLGQTSEYKDQYDPDLLVREPRSTNRKHLLLDDNDLPFVGFDTWNAYEVSGLTFNGLPATGVAKIVYPCDSKYIVESKSIKLYFNSFNMFPCADSPKDVLKTISLTAEEDLSALLETEVHVHIIDGHSELGQEVMEPLFPKWRYKTLEGKFSDRDLCNLHIDTYTESPEILEIDDITFDRPDLSSARYYHSGLLKSNCRVTSQPDWGDVYIYINSHNIIDEISLLKYIVSFRDECHFHEEICETIYKRLLDVYLPSELCVTCLYARRGGIDINPVRATSLQIIDKHLIDWKTLHTKTLKQ